MHAYIVSRPAAGRVSVADHPVSPIQREIQTARLVGRLAHDKVVVSIEANLDWLAVIKSSHQAFSLPGEGSLDFAKLGVRSPILCLEPDRVRLAALIGVDDPVAIDLLRATANAASIIAGENISGKGRGGEGKGG